MKNITLFVLIFLAIFVAIVVAICVFAPERLPSGIGLQPVPVNVSTRDSFWGEGKVAVISNWSGKTLHNVKIVCCTRNRVLEKSFFEETWSPGRTVELGWVEGWRFDPGHVLTISASGFRAKEWHW